MCRTRPKLKRQTLEKIESVHACRVGTRLCAIATITIEMKTYIGLTDAELFLGYHTQGLLIEKRFFDGTYRDDDSVW